VAKIIEHPANQKGCFLWQNGEMGRQIFPLQRIMMNENLGLIVAELKSENVTHFNKDLITFCKLHFRETVFKTQALNSVQNAVTLQMPSDVHVVELRKFPRQKFRPSDAIHITMKLKIGLMAHAAQQITLQVIDVSATGMSLLVPEHFIDQLTEAQDLLMVKIMDYELAIPLKNQLCYYHQFRFRQNGRITKAYRVGLKFSSKLSDYLLTQFR
jgi:c-di-GMP-binding flagellar brake protein YcgR